MSERYNVAASDVLGDNYKITNIVCSDYNPSIDSTITVTVSVDDVYGDAVSGESVIVTVSEGNFTQLNGSDITSASSVTGTTNSSGEFTLTYSCTEWGLITFTANNKSTQVSVTGWKQVQTLASDKVNVYTDGKFCKIRIGGSFTTGTSAGEYTLENNVSSTYIGIDNIVVNYTTATTTYFPVFIQPNSSAVKIYKGSTSSANVSCYCTLFYPLKTPLY